MRVAQEIKKIVVIENIVVVDQSTPGIDLGQGIHDALYPAYRFRLEYIYYWIKCLSSK